MTWPMTPQEAETWRYTTLVLSVVWLLQYVWALQVCRYGWNFFAGTPDFPMRQGNMLTWPLAALVGVGEFIPALARSVYTYWVFFPLIHLGLVPQLAPASFATAATVAMLAFGAANTLLTNWLAFHSGLDLATTRKQGNLA